MTHSTLFSAFSVRLCVLATGLALMGCDSASSSGGGARSGSSQGESQGGEFVPDPECAYDCVDASETETVCVQTCDDGCQSVVMHREVTGDDFTDVMESVSEQCLDEDIPAPEQLWSLSCELIYGASESEGVDEEGDCDEGFSAEACEVALDLCLPAG